MTARSDLTGFAALVGESLTARVELLDRLLQHAHYPSIGQYRERLLADTIRGYLPTSVEVGTGFVLFPEEDKARATEGDLFDPTNQSAYTVSRQCDILVFDSSRFPVVFKDGDFVVVRPEAVRAVIEVKGSLSGSETRSALESMEDFGRKWRATQRFYLSRNQATTPTPGLFLMSWGLQQRGGRNAVSPSRLRRIVADYYANYVPREIADGFPYLTQALVHNECEISAIHGMDDDGGTFRPKFGWLSQDGRFIRIGESG
jgi:hypothetical protein